MSDTQGSSYTDLMISGKLKELYLLSQASLSVYLVLLERLWTKNEFILWPNDDISDGRQRDLSDDDATVDIDRSKD